MAATALLVASSAGVSPSAAGPAPTAAHAGARESRVNADLVVKELQPGVWLHRSWNRDPDGVRTPANGLIVREDDGLVLIDTPWGEAPTAALLDWIARELKEPVLRAVATHAHDDRLGGARILHERAIPLLAAPRTVEIAAARDTRHLPTALAGLDEGEAVPFGTLEVFYPGPGHAPDNVVVWLPEQRILFGGCAVKAADATTLGFTGDADLARWPDSIRRVKQRYPQIAVVVPGHGDPGSAMLLDRTRVLLAHAGAKGVPATPTPALETTPTQNDMPKENR